MEPGPGAGGGFTNSSALIQPSRLRSTRSNERCSPYSSRESIPLRSSSLARKLSSGAAAPVLPMIADDRLYSAALT